MWVKICGTTSLEDAETAIEAGANALGFVFAPSPRQVTAAQVAAITAKLPRGIETFGVFLDAFSYDISTTVEVCGLTGVQLHSSVDPSLPLRLREHFSAISGRPRLGIVQVLHFRTPAELERELEALSHDHAVDAVLVDSRTAMASGGTGVPFDWAAASATFRRMAPHVRLVAAGGLTPENVRGAIETLAPWGVDVVTGVESAPGQKDPARVRAFVAAARSAVRSRGGI
jgi:phosphoribosylanthranilate isomerase